MEILNMSIDKAIELGATDIHLAPNCLPIYRVKRKLMFDETKYPLTENDLWELLEDFCKENERLKNDFEAKKQIDYAYTYKGYRFRINTCLTKGAPSFSIRVIPNGEIDINGNGIRDIVNKMRKVNNGLILVTGKVNSGKSTTLNAYIQEVNKELNKKIVTIEDPIEYVHESNQSVIIQKEVGEQSDVLDFHSALVNLLREDADIAVVGEIRDRTTMDLAIDLAESGELVLRNITHKVLW